MKLFFKHSQVVTSISQILKEDNFSDKLRLLKCHCLTRKTQRHYLSIDFENIQCT